MPVSPNKSFVPVSHNDGGMASLLINPMKETWPLCPPDVVKELPVSSVSVSFIKQGVVSMPVSSNKCFMSVSFNDGGVAS